MPLWVTVVVYAFAVARLTGLVTQDDITAPTRDGIGRRARGRVGRWAYELITCPWCVSVWVAAAVAPVAIWWPTRIWALWPALALAFSQVAGMVSRIGRG